MIAPGRRRSCTPSGPSSPSPRAGRIRFAGNLFADAMILVTVGTNEQPFDRLVRRPRRSSGDEPLLVQHGSSRVPHGRGEWIDFLPFDELAEQARRAARVVVCHAGVGSIMLARRCGHRPIVVPRRAAPRRGRRRPPAARSRGAFAQAGLVTLVEDEAQLRPRSGAPAVAPADDEPASLHAAPSR